VVQDRAVHYLLNNLENVPLGRHPADECPGPDPQGVPQQPGREGRYIKIILSLMSAPSGAVVYECAGTLIALSSAPTAIRAAANCYCQLLQAESDNNVKLIVLDRLQELKKQHREVQ